MAALYSESLLSDAEQVQSMAPLVTIAANIGLVVRLIIYLNCNFVVISKQLNCLLKFRFFATNYTNPRVLVLGHRPDNRV